MPFCSVHNLLPPTRRNAVLVFAAVAIFMSSVCFKTFVVDADMDRLRIGAFKAEVFAVRANERKPGLACFILGAIPLLAAVYVNYFFLNPFGVTSASKAGWASHQTTVSNALSTVRGKALLFASGFIGSFVLTLNLLSTFALICNYPLEDMAKLCTFSSDVIEVIRAKHGPDSAWVFKGTLIGVLRGNKDHNSMILNDHDYDVCYDRKLEPVIIDVVRSLGVTYERVSRPQTGTDEFIRIYPSWANLMSGHSGPNKIELEACDAVKTHMLKGCNDLPVPIPDNYEEWLSAEYGKDWRIPKAYNHGGLCAAFPGW